MVALSLFTGAGGFDLGAHSAGIEVVRGVELDPHAQATATAAGLPCILGDVSDVPAVVAGLPPIDLVFGGPPCQPFSRAGAQRGGEDARDGFPATLAILRHLRPSWAVLENVGGFLDACFDDYRHKLLSDLRALFYAVVVWRLDAADYGVPQHRRRCFIVCGPRALRAPTPTHAEHADLFGQVKPWQTPAWSSRPAPTVSTAEVRGTRASAKSGWMFNGGPDRASDALFLATGRRRLTIAECATLKAFPDGYPFQGPSEARYRQIGNAVPPPLAAAVLSAVVNHDR